MKNVKSMDQRMSILAIGWPILVEVLLRTVLGTSDVFMLSSYSDKAVSAVGVITQLTFFLMIVSSMVSSGTAILIAQFNGAGEEKKSTDVGVASLFLALLVGVFLSFIAVIGAYYFVPLYGLDLQVETYAQDYLIIAGVMTFNVTLGIVFSTILRSHGYSRSPMVVNLASGVINVLGNYIALYQPFGLPVYGVQGVAIATVISQLLGTIALWVVLTRSNIHLPYKNAFKVSKEIYRKILKIGSMNAGEILFYNIAQIIIVYFVVQMGTASLAAFTYAQNIARFSFAFSVALGQAAQIQTGYFVGKGWIESIHQKVQQYFVAGFIVSLTIAIVIYLLREPFLNLFTDDQEIVALTGTLIFASIFLEGGRVFNLIFISALKGAGDVKFPVQMGILSMWGIGVFMAYVLGLNLGYGVVGAWIAVAMDEWFRGLIMAVRWRSKEWVKFRLVDAKA
ncbi:MATE family efflux transporter [Vibrio sp. HN007]|uniref:MATE family efflux transporter n=1 Tax=Vibrio iocasae TaxID=3098914 RepID=UPI0035D4E143